MMVKRGCVFRDSQHEQTFEAPGTPLLINMLYQLLAVKAEMWTL